MTLLRWQTRSNWNQATVKRLSEKAWDVKKVFKFLLSRTYQLPWTKRRSDTLRCMFSSIQAYNLDLDLKCSWWSDCTFLMIRPHILDDQVRRWMIMVLQPLWVATMAAAAAPTFPDKTPRWMIAAPREWPVSYKVQPWWPKNFNFTTSNEGSSMKYEFRWMHIQSGHARSEICQDR